MKIDNQKNIISELEIALTYYIRGLTVKLTSDEFIFEVQRITEHALLSYSIIDFRKDNFLEPSISVSKKNIIIDLNNEKSKHSQAKKHIKIKIPYIEKKVFENPEIPESYVLGGIVTIKIIE